MDLIRYLEGVGTTTVTDLAVAWAARAVPLCRCEAS